MKSEYISSIRYHDLNVNIQYKPLPPFKIYFTCLLDIIFKNNTVIYNMKLSFDEKGNIIFSFPIYEMDWKNEFLQIINYKLPKLSQRIFNSIKKDKIDVKHIFGNIGQKEIEGIE